MSTDTSTTHADGPGTRDAAPAAPTPAGRTASSSTLVSHPGVPFPRDWRLRPEPAAPAGAAGAAGTADETAGCPALALAAACTQDAVVHAPDLSEKYAYLGPQKRWLLLVQAAVFSVVGLTLLRLSLQRPWLWPIGLVFALFVLYSSVGLLTTTRRRRVSQDSHDALVAAWAPDRHPSVDVFLPSCGEPLDVIANTMAHVGALVWPGRLVVHVLDDGARPQVRHLAERHGFAYHSRPDRGRLKKAGNLAFGYGLSDGDIIAIFDADFCPRPDFLTELVPYFDDPAVGIVQSPQFFDTGRGMSWLQRTAGSTQEMFYRWVQPARDAVDGAICVGTNALYRRAGLQRSGGFAQIGHSEDVHTGVNLLKVGYSTRYVPVVVAKGLCPDELNGFISQQYRWCTGSMSLLADPDFHTAPLSRWQRLCFWSGFLYYISTAVNVFATPIPPLVMLWLFPQDIDTANCLPFVAAAWLWMVLIPSQMHSRWRLEVMRVQAVAAFAHAVAIWHTLAERTAGWVPTGAARRPSPLATTVGRLMRSWIAVSQALLWTGLVVAAAHRGYAHLWPMSLLMAANAYVLLPLLLPPAAVDALAALRRSPRRSPRRSHPERTPA